MNFLPFPPSFIPCAYHTVVSLFSHVEDRLAKAAASTVGDSSCFTTSISFCLLCLDQGQTSPGGHKEGGEVEGDRAHIAATCLPRKGRASQQTWQQTGAASAAWGVTEEQLPPRGPCRQTWLLSSGFHPGSSPAEDTAIWQQAPLWKERGDRSFRDPKEQSHREEAGSVPDPESWNHPKASRYHSEFITCPSPSTLNLRLGCHLAT